MIAPAEANPCVPVAAGAGIPGVPSRKRAGQIRRGDGGRQRSCASASRARARPAFALVGAWTSTPFRKGTADGARGPGPGRQRRRPAAPGWSPVGWPCQGDPHLGDGAVRPESWRTLTLENDTGQGHSMSRSTKAASPTVVDLIVFDCRQCDRGTPSACRRPERTYSRRHISCATRSPRSCGPAPLPGKAQPCEVDFPGPQ